MKKPDSILLPALQPQPFVESPQTLPPPLFGAINRFNQKIKEFIESIDLRKEIPSTEWTEEEFSKTFSDVELSL